MHYSGLGAIKQGFKTSPPSEALNTKASDVTWTGQGLDLKTKDSDPAGLEAGS